jgi:BioD-like phosphotransacetylase family protein
VFFQHFMGTLDDHDPAFTRKYERQEDMWLPILFAPTDTSQAAERAARIFSTTSCSSARRASSSMISHSG